jgi:hypothetical protein
VAFMQGVFGPADLGPCAPESFAVFAAFAVQPGGVDAGGARLGMLVIAEVIGAVAPGAGVPRRVQRLSPLPTILMALTALWCAGACW